MHGISALYYIRVKNRENVALNRNFDEPGVADVRNDCDDCPGRQTAKTWTILNFTGEREKPRA
jgi:hypothetical protein